MPPSAPRPPTVEGTVALRWIDGLRLLGWIEAGYIHAAIRGNVAAGFLALGWIAALPVTLLAQPFVVTRVRARYYMTPERDAVLAVVATRHGWKIDDHLSSKPGTGQGKALRAVLMPALVAAADTHQLAIRCAAADPTLEHIYRNELPGLVDVGRAWPRGRTLQRPPIG